MECNLSGCPAFRQLKLFFERLCGSGGGIGIRHVHHICDSSCSCRQGFGLHVCLVSQTRLPEMHMSINSACHQPFAFKIDDLQSLVLLDDPLYTESVVLTIRKDDLLDCVAYYEHASDSLLLGGDHRCIMKKYRFHYFLGLIFLILSFITPQNASPKIPLLIFDVPSVLSTKMIGTS